VIRGPEGLLGRALEEPEVSAYLSQYGCLPKPDDDEDRLYWSFCDAGVAILTTPNKVIETVFLYNAKHEGYSTYVGPIPLGLRLDQGRWAFRDRLGQPTFQRPAGEVEHLGRKGPMERYDLPSFSIHIEYAEATGQVLVMTLMEPTVVPGADDLH
jgi:hypothetical protein